MAIVKWGPYVERTNRSVGKYYGSDINSSSTETVNHGYSAKATPVSSDGHSPTGHSREEVRVIADEPFIERHAFGGHTDYTDTRYISRMKSDPAFWAVPDDFWPLVANAEAKAENECRNNLAQRKFSIGQFVAEARATAEMLAGRGTDLASAVIGFRRQSGGRRSVPERFAGAWLEGHYGWGSSARDAFELYGALNEQLKKSQTIRTSSRAETVKDYSSRSGALKTDSKWTAKALVGCQAHIESDISHAMEQWGLLNPVSVAWNSVPLSFCVDWLIPIGNTLESLTATAGLGFDHGFRTTSFTCHSTSRINPLWTDAQVQNPGEYTVDIFSYGRRTLSGFPLPRLYANENPFSTNRIISAVALITQAVLGHK